MRDKQEVEIVDFLLQVKASMVSEYLPSSQAHVMNDSAYMHTCIHAILSLIILELFLFYTKLP